ncbi:nose resistant to fluoxetine protein 6-like [Ornithodoros turicata]|uniref:nose resistant to fluoxetine protein 6-like n=1 Tax=Ornithodoros turicata TaxID=34597 RepID=UPI0031393B48
MGPGSYRTDANVNGASTSTFARYQLDPRVQGLLFGLCIPTFCDKEDVEKLLGSLLTSAPVEVSSCVTNEYPPIDTTQACIIAFLVILALVIVVSSAIDIYHQHKAGPKAKKGLLIKILTVFSAPSSTRLLLEINNDPTSDAYRYRFLHGIRFFSMFMIIFGHSYSVFNFANVSRLVNALHYGDNLSFCFIFTGYLSVDTFLFLGGFLLTYNLLKEKASRIVVIVVAVLRRYIRGTVPAFFVIMFFYLMPLIADGPNAQLLFKNFYTEVADQWWSILLQIRNLSGGLETGAFGHLWYLSTDFQLFVASAIVVQVLRRRPWMTIGTLVTLIIACNSFCTWQMNNEAYTPFVMPMAETFRSLVETLNEMYTLPTTHAPAFFAGCICTLLIQKYKEVKMSKVAVMGCWLVSIGFGFTAVFTMHFWLRGDSPPMWANMLFAFWNRTLWATWMCWMAFACATGRASILARFLSWSPFVPLSRLCFGVYLVHLPFYFVKYFTAREKLFFSHFTMVSQAFAVTIWSYLLSYLVFIACEVPVGRIEKLILTRARNKRVEDSNGNMHTLENGYKPPVKPKQDDEEDDDDSNNGSDNNGQSSYL